MFSSEILFILFLCSVVCECFYILVSKNRFVEFFKDRFDGGNRWFDCKGRRRCSE